MKAQIRIGSLVITLILGATVFAMPLWLHIVGLIKIGNDISMCAVKGGSGFAHNWDVRGYGKTETIHSLVDASGTPQTTTVHTL